MTTPAFATLAQVDRDRWGRPLIKQPDGKAIGYQRCTTFVSCIEDNSNIVKWKLRMVMEGLRLRPDLALRAAGNDDKKDLNWIADEAMNAAGAHKKADTGTLVHSYTEAFDRGETVTVKPEHKADLQAYAMATRNHEMLAVETFVVLDDYRVGGTFDRLVRHPTLGVVIGDVKTGDVDWGQLKMAMQLAVYAHGETYDPVTGHRGPLSPMGDVNRQKGIIYHLPAGKGICTPYVIDLQLGWEAVGVAVDIHRLRKEKKIMIPDITDMPDPTPAEIEALAIRTLDEGGVFEADPLLKAIDLAQSYDELKRIWASNKAVWNPGHTARAEAKKGLLDLV